MRVQKQRQGPATQEESTPTASLLRCGTAEGTVSYLSFETVRDKRNCKWVPALNGIDKKVRRQLK